MNCKLKWLCAAFVVALASCMPPDASIGAGHAEPEPEAAPTNRVAIPATVRSNLSITFAQVEVRRVAKTLRVPGAFELEPRARREYRLALPGRVELLVDQYEHVIAGQPLYRFQSPAWPELLHEIILGEQAMGTANAEIELGAARIGEAEAKLGLLRARLESLAEADFKNADLEAQVAELEATLPRLRAEVRVTEMSLVNAQRTRKHALERAGTAAGIPVAELEAETMIDGERVPVYETIDWIEVRALDAGVVEELALTDGAYGEAPAKVLSVVDPSRVRFRATALQADLSKLLDTKAARIVAPTTGAGAMSDGVAATMTIGLEAHPEERTVTLLAQPAEARSWIRSGVSAFLEIVTDSTDAPSLAIPRAAVVQDGLVHVFFRRDPKDPNQAIRIEADLGVSDGVWVVVNSGVMKGNEVVLSGAFELKLATQQGGGLQKGGHFHADGTFHAEDD